MRSTFMGLETNKRGLFTQQSALYTTGHNISNANTAGYSRQRVNMEPTLGYPGMGLNAPKTPGFIGTGVQAGSVQRIRDEFIDRQFRQETNKLGYYESRAKAIAQMEDVMSEPSEYGLDEAFRMFWSSLQDVSANPEDIAARKVAIQRAQHLADSFNYIDTQLKQIQGNLGNEIDVSITHINSVLEQIADINRQIQAVEPNGYVPNDLYDKRDMLVDELNEYLPVSIQRVPSGGNASDVAEGSYTITLKPEGQDPIILVHGREFAKLSTMGTNGAAIDGNDTDNLLDYVRVDWTGSATTDVSMVNGNLPTGNQLKQSHFEPGKGKLLSLIDSYGYVNATDNEGYYPEMLKALDDLAETFITKFNEQHALGFTLTTDTHTSQAGQNFFEGTTAATIKVVDDIINNPHYLAASDASDEEGNGQNALDLADLQSTPLGELDGGTFQSYYQGLIGQLGVDGQKVNQLKTTSETNRLSVENNRASMSSVSLDEEMTDMIRFQQAYNANARMITVIDETLDKIINGMGRVGL